MPSRICVPDHLSKPAANLGTTTLWTLFQGERGSAFGEEKHICEPFRSHQHTVADRVVLLFYPLFSMLGTFATPFSISCTRALSTRM